MSKFNDNNNNSGNNKGNNGWNEDRNAPIRAYTTGELIELYDIKRHTWYRWMKKHAHVVGPKEGRVYTPKQVRIIFEQIDPPPASK
jgi:hypothetical protein